MTRGGASLTSQVISCRIEIPVDAMESGLCMSHIVTKFLCKRFASPIWGIGEIPATEEVHQLPAI